MIALITGATGATGRDLVQLLLQDNQYTIIVIFVRRPIGISAPKLFEVLTDFDNLEQVAGFIKGDVWFSCLGTTRKAAGSKEQQWHVDYGIPVKFAGIAKRNGVASVVLLSAYGASPASNVFYSKMKGKLEERIGALAFERYIIFRPGLLLRKGSSRVGERIFAALLKLLNKLGIARKFKPLPTSLLAGKLTKAPKVLGPGKHIISLDEIFSF